MLGFGGKVLCKETIYICSYLIALPHIIRSLNLHGCSQALSTSQRSRLKGSYETFMSSYLNEAQY